MSSQLLIAWVEKWIAFGSWKSGRVLLELLFVLILLYPWDWIHNQSIHWFEWSFSFAIYLLLLKENKKTYRYKLFSKHSNYICFFYKKKILYYIKRYLIKVWQCGHSHISRHINFYIQFFSKYIVIIFLSIFEAYSSTSLGLENS